MGELNAIANTMQLIVHGASWDEIRQSAGFGYLWVTSALIILPTILGLATGVLSWRETPLAQKLGFKQSEPKKDAWVNRACRFEQTR